MNWYEGSGASIICLQELKIKDAAFINTLSFPHHPCQFWYLCDFTPAYSGTAILSSIEPQDVIYGIGNEALDQECRCITLDMDSYFLITVYMPNAEHKLSRKDLRNEWDSLFYDMIVNFAAQKPIILCGDLNCTLSDDDIRPTLPRSLSGMFSPQTRFNILDLMNRIDLIDVFRFMNPDLKYAYTWWSIRKNKIKDNIGWRLDYFLASRELANKIIACGMLAETYSSDHCPIFIDMSP